MKAHVGGTHGRELSVTIGDVGVHFTLDALNAAKHLERERQGYLSLSPLWATEPSARSCEDAKGDRLERHLREILVEMIVSAEQRVRDGAAGRREWLIQRKAELQEEQHKRAIEEESRRRARQAKLEQARIDHLLGQANALHQAGQIRLYVAGVREINARAPDPMTPEALDEWALWALAQADRIDQFSQVPTRPGLRSPLNHRCGETAFA
jgi:hypothetical protein